MNFKKNIFYIKVSLILFVICISGVYTSYAIFSEVIEVKPKLKITMGNLNTKIVNAINIDEVGIDSYVEDTFSVENTGTLNENIIFYLENPINIHEDGLSNIYYEIIFYKENGEQSKIYSGVLKDLFNGKLTIEDINDEAFIISSGEIIEGNIKISIDKDMPYKYSNKEVYFDMCFQALLDNSDSSFTSISNERSSIKISDFKPPKDIINLQTIRLSGNKLKLKFNKEIYFQDNNILDNILGDEEFLENTNITIDKQYINIEKILGEWNFPNDINQLTTPQLSLKNIEDNLGNKIYPKDIYIYRKNKNKLVFIIKNNENIESIEADVIYDDVIIE